MFAVLPMGLLRVFLSDDHPILRIGLRRILESQPDIIVVGEAGDATMTLAGVAESSPDIVLLDLSMPGGGLTALRTLRERFPQIRVLVVTQHEDHGHLALALQNGASGYLIKTAPPEELLRAVRMLQAGRTYTSPCLVASAMRDSMDVLKGKPPDILSPREREVVRLVARGHTAREAAEKLGLSVKTVEAYRQRVMEKLGLESRAELVSYALGAGLLFDQDGNPER